MAGLSVQITNPDDLAAASTGLTDAQLRASAVAVTVSNPQDSLGLTDAQLRAAAVPVGLTADAAQGTLKSIAVTLSASAGTVTTITLPDSAQGVRLYPTSYDIRFAIGEDPAAEATASGTTVAAAAFAVGAVAKADQWEVRLLGAGASRTLRLRSATASVVVQVGTF